MFTGNDAYIAHELKKSIAEIDDAINSFTVSPTVRNAQNCTDLCLRKVNGISFTVSSIGGPDGLNEQLKHGLGQVKDKLARLPEEVAIQIMLHVANLNGIQALEMTNPELQRLNAKALTVRAHILHCGRLCYNRQFCFTSCST